MSTHQNCFIAVINDPWNYFWILTHQICYMVVVQSLCGYAQVNVLTQTSKFFPALHPIPLSKYIQTPHFLAWVWALIGSRTLPKILRTTSTSLLVSSCIKKSWTERTRYIPIECIERQNKSSQRGSLRVECERLLSCFTPPTISANALSKHSFKSTISLALIKISSHARSKYTRTHRQSNIGVAEQLVLSEWKGLLQQNT